METFVVKPFDTIEITRTEVSVRTETLEWLQEQRRQLEERKSTVQKELNLNATKQQLLGAIVKVSR